MLLKKFYLVLFAALLGFSIIGCGSDSDTKSVAPSVTDEEAVEMSDSVMKAVDAAFAEAYTKKGEATKAIVSGEWDYEGTGWSAHGEYSYDDADNYPMNIDIVFTWESFTYDDPYEDITITISNGTAEVVYDVPSDTMFSYDYTGDFDVLYEGTTYDFSWAISVDYNYPNYTYAGTYSINSYSYTYSGSGTVKE